MLESRLLYRKNSHLASAARCISEKNNIAAYPAGLNWVGELVDIYLARLTQAILALDSP